MTERPFQSDEEPCGVGEERGSGEGCLMWEGHSGPHMVRTPLQSGDSDR